MDTITLRSEVHGTYQCRPRDLDTLIKRYLPATTEELEHLITERHGAHYPISSRIEGLMVLAELDGYATN